MTNHWIDIKNADVILAMGSNPAENHPISFKWVMEAKKQGATLISVDPRFTRTSSKADIFAALRSGSDLAFLNGMIKYILDTDSCDEYYLKHYTNGAFIVNKDFKTPGDLDGVFSGFDSKEKTYDKSTWSFEVDENGVIKKDHTLKDPNCVYQLLKKHTSRYTLEMVESLTGTPKAKLLEVYKTYAQTGTVNKAGTIMYAVGWTQHTIGTQIIRTMAMIQLLLGNIGIPGGGVNALRGESNVQGATDHCILFHILPGYLKTPKSSQKTLEDYNKAYTPESKEPNSANWWGNYPKYSVSLLKAFYGENGVEKNDFGYNWLPKLDDGQNASWLMLFDKMFKGDFKGFFIWGQNPACSSSNADKVRKALTKLDWIVNVSLMDSESASFWHGPGMDPAKIDTEVFQLPCALSVEKEGSLTNSGRWVQWRYKAVEPPGEAKPDSWIINEIYSRVKALYKTHGGAYPDSITNLSWNYGKKDAVGKVIEMDVHKIAHEINGIFLKDTTIKGKLYKKGTLVPNFTYLQEDGSTSSGNWLYSGSYTEAGNMMARRSQKDDTGLGLYPEWSWCWPVNRRVLYNRASVDENGMPRNKKRPLLTYDGKKWVGDVPDGGWPPLSNKEKTKQPFIMKPHGVGSIFGPGLVDGPLPEHYEPLESPIANNPLSKSHRINPIVKMFYAEGKGLKEDIYKTNSPEFPIVATTYRVTEHWETGTMTRNMPWLMELMPQQFIEISKELAKEKSIKNGDKVIVTSARHEIWAIAIVTGRFKPFKIQSKTVHEVGMPFCFGWKFPKDGSGGDSSNLLAPTIGDPNTMIPETKAFMVNIKKA